MKTLWQKTSDRNKWSGKLIDECAERRRKKIKSGHDGGTHENEVNVASRCARGRGKRWREWWNDDEESERV